MGSSAPFDPQKYLAEKQASQTNAPQTALEDPVKYLQSKGVQTLPNGGDIQDGATAAKSYANSIGNAAQQGAGGPLGTSASAGLEAGLGAAQSLVTGSNNFGDEGRFSGISNFVDNFKRAKLTQDNQISLAAQANPKTFAATQFLTSVPRLIGETEGLGFFGTGALESGGQTLANGGSARQVATSAITGGATNQLLGSSLGLLGKGFNNSNLVDGALGTLGKTLGPGAEDAATKAIGDGISKQIANQTLKFSALALGGGATDILIRQPDTWDNAIKDFKEGAGVAVGLGLVKTAGVSLFNWGANVIAETEAKAAQTDVANQQDVIKNLQASLDLKNKAINTANQGIDRLENNIQQTQSTIDTASTQKSKLTAVLNSEPQIASRVTNLPTFIDNTLSQHMDITGAKIADKIAGFDSAKQIDLYPQLKNAYDDISGVKAFTQDAQSAKNAAQNMLSTFENGLNRTNSTIDPITNMRVGSNTATTDPQSLWKAKQQIQDLLYNKDFLNASKGTNLRQVLTNFEQNVRESLNSLDPSGELPKLNDVYSNAQRARQAFQTDGDLSFMLQKASNPNDPRVIATTQNLEKWFMDSDSLKREGIKYGGLKPETAADPVLGNQVKAVKGLIDAESSSALTDYAAVQNAKKTLPQVQSIIDQGSSKLETLKLQQQVAATRLERAQLAASQGELNLTKANQSLRDIQSPDYETPFLGSLRKKGEFFTGIGKTIADRPGFQATLTGLNAVKNAATLGARDVLAPKITGALTTVK